MIDPSNDTYKMLVEIMNELVEEIRSMKTREHFFESELQQAERLAHNNALESVACAIARVFKLEG